MRMKPLNQVCEQWKEFSDLYYICDNGFIYRKIRKGFYKKLKPGYFRGRKYGYMQTRGYFGTKKQHTIKNARACALAFVPNPLGLSDVDHIDNDKTNNRWDNLQWLSHRDNLVKRYADAKKKGA